MFYLFFHFFHCLILIKCFKPEIFRSICNKFFLHLMVLLFKVLLNLTKTSVLFWFFQDDETTLEVWDQSLDFSLGDRYVQYTWKSKLLHNLQDKPYFCELYLNRISEQAFTQIRMENSYSLSLLFLKKIPVFCDYLLFSHVLVQFSALFNRKINSIRFLILAKIPYISEYKSRILGVFYKAKVIG